MRIPRSGLNTSRFPASNGSDQASRASPSRWDCRSPGGVSPGTSDRPTASPTPSLSQRSSESPWSRQCGGRLRSRVRPVSTVRPRRNTRNASSTSRRKCRRWFTVTPTTRFACSSLPNERKEGGKSNAGNSLPECPSPPGRHRAALAHVVHHPP